jgi:prevent-host-death family protein
MRLVGVRELKAHTSAVLRRVRERGETVGVTHRGRVVARIVPVEQPPVELHELGAVWTDLDRLAAEIAVHWPANVTAPDAVREDRREL